MPGSLAAAEEMVDELLAMGPRRLTDRESMIAVRRLRAKVDLLVTRMTGVFDADRAWEADKAPSAQSWLVWFTHEPAGRAQRDVRLARQLRHQPACEKAWAAGEITGDHVAVIARARTDKTAEAMERDEPTLVANATKFRFDVFTRSVNYWKLRADPVGAEDDERDRHADREVHLDHSFQGMWLGKMTLDPISGEIVHTELSAREHEMFLADWAEAKARLGREPTVLELRRTAAQRRADALVEMAIRSRTAPAGGRRPAPLFTVHVGYETMRGPLCELDRSRIVLAPGALLPWLTTAHVERAVWKSPTRIEVGETDRFFTGATRRAIEIRDRECTNPFCTTPGHRCQADHIIPYTKGGPTTQDNGQLHCPHHNAQKGDRSPPTDDSG